MLPESQLPSGPTGPLATRPPVIDEEVLDSYRMLQDDGQPDVVTELIDTFLDDLPRRLDAIRKAVASGDPSSIKSAGHALKGSSAIIGAARLSAACAELEAMGRSGETARAGDLPSQIAAEAGQAARVLATLRRP